MKIQNNILFKLVFWVVVILLAIIALFIYYSYPDTIFGTIALFSAFLFIAAVFFSYHRLFPNPKMTESEMKTEDHEFMKEMLVQLPYIKAFDLCMQSTALFDSAKIEESDHAKGIIVVSEPNVVLSLTPYSQHLIFYHIHRAGAMETKIEVMSKSISASYPIVNANKQNVDMIISFLEEHSSPMHQELPEYKRKLPSLFFIAFLSLIIPGSGQVRNNQMKKAIVAMGGTAVFLLFSIEVGIVMWLIFVCDAFFVARKRNSAKIFQPIDKFVQIKYAVLSILFVMVALIGHNMLNHVFFKIPFLL